MQFSNLDESTGAYFLPAYLLAYLRELIHVVRGSDLLNKDTNHEKQKGTTYVVLYLPENEQSSHNNDQVST